MISHIVTNVQQSKKENFFLTLTPKTYVNMAKLYPCLSSAFLFAYSFQKNNQNFIDF